MKKIKRLGLISILGSLMLCIGLFAACNTNNNENNGDNNDTSPFTYTYKEQDDCYLVKAKNKDIAGEIVIPSTYNGKKVILADSAFSRCSKITSVTIPDSVTTISHDAFFNCSSLISISIPDSVTSIDYSAFGACVSLVSVTIPDSVISIWNSAFSNCTALASVILGTNVTSIGSAAFKDNSSKYVHTKVYYKGTKDDWSKITMSISDAFVTYFFSAEQPTESGYYWHYDNNGNVEVWPTT